MRVTNNMMATFLKTGLLNKTQSLIELAEKVTTGKQINRPSDNPMGISKVIGYRKSISMVEQYMSNIDRGKTQIEVMENVLEEVENIIDLAKNTSSDQSMSVLETRQTAAEQIKNYYDQLLGLANTKLGDVYLFAGNNSSIKPFSANSDGIIGTSDDYDAIYSGDDGAKKIIIGESNLVKISSNGNEVFTGESYSEGINIFNVLKDLINGLENDDAESGTLAIRNQIELLEKAQRQVNQVRTKNAGIYDQMEISYKYWEDFKAAMEKQLSKIEDADINQTVVDLINQELAYETTIFLASEIFKLNLMDFLN